MDVPVGLVNHRRSDFLRMMRQLGADPGVSYCRFDAAAGEIRDIQHVYLRCRYEEWVKAFGEPEAVSPALDWADAVTLRTWQHPCADGPVTCIGHLVEYPAGARWVIVVRVSSFE